MSATNRGGQRSPADYYPTPSWCVDRLLDAVGDRLFPLNGADPVFWEPCVGNGAIVNAVDAWAERHGWEPPRWLLSDVEPRTPPEWDVFVHDAAKERPVERQLFVDVAITNPPFSQALEITVALLSQAQAVVVLQRLNWLASEARLKFWRTYHCHVYILPNRPSFTDGGKTDSIEYAWFLFCAPYALGYDGGRQWHLLDATPAEERRAK